MANFVLTVTQLNSYVRSIIEGDENLNQVFVTGEISNFKNHFQSGHFYFSLKDSGGLIRCVMFRTDAIRLKFIPQDGMKILCRGRVSLYEKDGQYQFYINDMQPDGVGSLSVAFEQVKSRLSKEGLFDSQIKKTLPKLPRKIAVVTSETGAAIKDILTILGRRAPFCDIIICPVLVQGNNAAEDMINTLYRLYNLDGIDIIIIGRGGGSAEDLWAFNDETLARTIRLSPIPIISAVGHETDYTICDFTADLRAPTPSAAAELAVPDKNDLINRLTSLERALNISIENIIINYENKLSKLNSNRMLKNPQFLLDQWMLKTDVLTERLLKSYNIIVKQKSFYFQSLMASLNILSPLNVLSRGYSVVYKNSEIINSIKSININDKITIQLCDGVLDCSIDNLNTIKN